jgi:hypothetical protein
VSGKPGRCHYQIDGGKIQYIGDRPLRSEDIVRKEAIDHAKWAIDQTEKK